MSISPHAIVQLVTGGPAMAVQWVSEAGEMAMVNWVTADGKLQTAHLRTETLRPYVAPEPEPPAPTVEWKVKQGDPVQLASGGPPMTVDHLQGPGCGAGWVNVTWFDDKKVVQKGRFHQDALRIINP